MVKSVKLPLKPQVEKLCELGKKSYKAEPISRSYCAQKCPVNRLLVFIIIQGPVVFFRNETHT